jgi:hypothetical protein
MPPRSPTSPTSTKCRGTFSDPMRLLRYMSKRSRFGDAFAIGTMLAWQSVTASGASLCSKAKIQRRIGLPFGGLVMCGCRRVNPTRCLHSWSSASSALQVPKRCFIPKATSPSAGCGSL